MRRIKGFVCLAVNDRKKGFLFGKNTGEGVGTFQNFETNNLTPFVSLSEAEAAQEGIWSFSDIRDISIVHLEMNLAETRKEIYSFKNRKNLVVVRKEDDWYMMLIGECKEEHGRYPLYGSLLADNGLYPFFSFDSALYVAGEENRQSGCPVFMATFKIKRL